CCHISKFRLCRHRVRVGFNISSDFTRLYSKIKPIAVTKGIGIEKHDKEGRCLTAEYDTFFLVTTYIPNSGQKLQNLNYRYVFVGSLHYVKTAKNTRMGR